MTVDQAIANVLFGESLASIAAAYREEHLRGAGLDPRSALPQAFARETGLFLRKVCRVLGERHAGDRRVLAALREWVDRATDYEAWDALLAHFEFEGKEAWVRRGRLRFPGPLTAHWGP